MSRRGRLTLFLPAALVLAGLLAWALVDLPAFGKAGGEYGVRAVDAALHQRHVANTVAGVVFDVRGVDTLGEELILFAAAIGSAVLLRAHPRAAGRRPPVSDALEALAAALVAPVLVLGVYVIAHGHISPGGGFQGGVLVAGALLLVYAAAQRLTRPTAPAEVAEAVGALAFALVAAGGLVFASVALENFLPLGVAGDLLSGGTIPLLEVMVGVEVAGAIALVLAELLGGGEP